MDVSHLLDDLNDAQRAAVTAAAGPLLVLAGAGSGKTRVLTHRVAWLVGVEGISPHSILAVTFTNKAAAEMRGRIERLLGAPVAGMWIGTFHGLSHRLLRSHWREAKLPQGFQILDAEDQLRLIKRVLKGLNLDEAYWPPRQAQWFINGHKEDGRRPQQLPESVDPTQRELQRIYRSYEDSCQRAGLVDFAELLLRAFELLRDDSPLRAHYQRRFQHVLVDEFQDTNAIQYEWLKLLAGDTQGANVAAGASAGTHDSREEGGRAASGAATEEVAQRREQLPRMPRTSAHANLFVVGDDDQSIYGWRGARVENILQFERDHPGARVVRLEQNYRSTGNILKAANSVVRHNDGRLGKNLWTADAEGEPIYLYTAYNDLDEARFVIGRIEEWVEQGRARAECAVLYRSNAQSRLFEEALLNAAMPYRVYGGLRFFERQEIKDALAYLRLIAARQDDASFERVANVPTRGLGAKTMDAVRERARADQSSLWEAARRLLAAPQLPARAVAALSGFLALIERLAQDSAALVLAEQVEQVLQHAGLLDYYRKEKGERAESRVENLEELVSAARGFEYDDSDGLDPLSAFLAHAALEAGEGQAEAWEDCVQLMSLHSAKGLEFPMVFLTGLEEGLFPHERSVNEPGRLEEERRLCYVGMTRARERLILSHAELRRVHGTDHYTSPSRFLGEVDAGLIQEIRAAPNLTLGKSASGGAPREAPAGMRLGGRVRHAQFGEGVVLKYEGEGSHARVHVNFEGVGAKWLVLAYANLQQLR